MCLFYLRVANSLSYTDLLDEIFEYIKNILADGSLCLVTEHGISHDLCIKIEEMRAIVRDVVVIDGYLCIGVNLIGPVDPHDYFELIYWCELIYHENRVIGFKLVLDDHHLIDNYLTYVNAGSNLTFDQFNVLNHN